MSRIQITRPCPETGATRVDIDGVNMSREIRRLNLDFDGGAAPRVTIDLIGDKDQRLCVDDAVLVLSPETFDLLQRHGWTAPAVGGAL